MSLPEKKLGRNSIILFIAALALAGNTWLYVMHVLVPMQKAYDIAHQVPRGNLSDLYPRWLGSRELLLHGRNPYSEEVTREIQTGYYGRPLDKHRPNDPRDQEGFVYPVYVVFLLAPTILLPFEVVQAGFYWLLIATIVVTTVLWFRTLRWKPEWLTLLTAIVLSLGNFPVIQALALRQLSALVAGFLALVFFLVARRNFMFAGLVLSVATIKPQLTIPVACWLGLWMVSCWRERRGLFFGFFGGVIVLFASAQSVLPGWIEKFYYAVLAYRKYTGGLTSADVLLGLDFGRATNVLLILITGAICWQTRRKNESSAEFSLVSCFVLAATVAITPIFAPYNQLLLFPGFLVLVRYRDVLRHAKTSWKRILLAIAILMVCWQWIASICLTMIRNFASARFAERMWAMPFYVSLALPVVVMCLLYVCLRGINTNTVSRGVC